MIVGTLTASNTRTPLMNSFEVLMGHSQLQAATTGLPPLPTSLQQLDTSQPVPTHHPNGEKAKTASSILGAVASPERADLRMDRP